MSKTHLTYDDSVAMKNRGFDEPCDRKWYQAGGHVVSTNCGGPFKQEELLEGEVLRPSYTQASNWLQNRIDKAQAKVNSYGRDGGHIPNRG